MAKPYLDDLTKLLARVVPRFAADDGVECRHFFSGAAAYVNACMFMSLTPAGLALKLPEIRRTELMAAGGEALQYFPKAPIKKEYVVLPGDIREQPAVLAALIIESAEYAQPVRSAEKPG